MIKTEYNVITGSNYYFEDSKEEQLIRNGFRTEPKKKNKNGKKRNNT